MATKKTTPKAPPKPRNTADLLALGRSSRKVCSAANPAGWHQFGAQWSSDHMAQLVRCSAAFRRFVFAIAAERSPVFAGFKRGRQSKTLASAASAFETWAKSNPRQAGSAIAGLLEELRGNYVNPLRMHPLDLMRLLKMLASGWEEAADGAIGPVAIGEASRFARMNAGSDNAAFQALQTLRKRAYRLKGSFYRVLQAAGQFLYSLNHNVLMGFYQRAGLRPWRLGASPKNVVGVEIVEIGYKVPVEFDDKGNPISWLDNMTHPCASLAVERVAKNDSQLRGGLALTPAGRLWLVWHKGRMALATDRKPKRPLFIVDQRSATDARMRNVFEATHAEAKLTGLVV